MKTLYIVRHAKAAELILGITDFDRPLTHHGREQAKNAAKFIKSQNIPIDSIISSPALRAQDTAKIIASEYKFPKKQIQLIESMYQTTPEGLIDLIETMDNDVNHLMLVGHNPPISELAQRLCKDIKSSLKPGSVVILQNHLTSWDQICNKHNDLIQLFQPE